MKKILTVLAVFAMVSLVSCKKDEVATITASDVTVEEGASVKINARTNSTAAITYASADAAVATVSATGEVTGVKAGNTTVTLKVAAVKGFTAAEKSIKVTVTAKAVEPEPQGGAIEIDGKFEDWAALPAGSFSKSYGDPEATHPALTQCKVYADPNFIYVYFEWDPEYVDGTADATPFHCYINTDGKTSTGGYGDEFLDACSEVLLEGWIYDGAEGILQSYDPLVQDWVAEPNTNGWGWSGVNLIEDGSGLGEGAGVEGKYEFKLDRSMLKDVGFPVADVFSIGFDIQQNWESVGVIPNAAPSEENASGVVNSLQVTTQK
jgi:hypothetical protein